MKVIIGTPIHRNGAYALDKFLANQQQIQENYPDCCLVFSTDDPSYVDELKGWLHQWNLRGTVITHKVEKPDYAKSRLWTIASGRESIRQYVLSYPEAQRLLFLDSDMTYDPDVIYIMEKVLENQEAVFSGYRFRNNRIGLTGAGCLLLRREALQKIKFRCYEFKNGQVINEDNTAEMDLYHEGCHIRKGFFLTIYHYASASEAKQINPQKVGWYRKLMTSAFIRYWLMKISVAIHINIASMGQKMIWTWLRFFEKSP